MLGNLEKTVIYMMSAEVVYVKNGIVKSFYELPDNHLQEGNSYRHIGRTISLNGKHIPSMQI